MPAKEPDAKHLEKIERAARRAHRSIMSHFMPFLVSLDRKGKLSAFLPRRFLESPKVAGVIAGFAGHEGRKIGLKSPQDRERVVLGTFAMTFEWPADSLSRLFDMLGVLDHDDFEEGVALALAVMADERKRQKPSHLKLIGLIDEEYYRVAKVRRDELSNPVLRQVAKLHDVHYRDGW